MYLKDSAMAKTAAEIEQDTGVDLSPIPRQQRRELRKAIKEHKRIRVLKGDQNTRLRYKPDFPGVIDRQSLLACLRKHPGGIAMECLEGSYPQLHDDLTRLQQHCDTAPRMITVTTNGHKQQIVYPIHTDVVQLDVDDDIKKLWNSVVIPGDSVELERKLQEAGFLAERDLKQERRDHIRRFGDDDATTTAYHRRAKQRRVGPITNEHLLDNPNYAWMTS
jgi:TFA2 Winged helix domain 2